MASAAVHSDDGQDLEGCRFLVFAWVVLMLAWFAVGYLPGGANSVHVYTR